MSILGGSWMGFSCWILHHPWMTSNICGASHHIHVCYMYPRYCRPTELGGYAIATLVAGFWGLLEKKQKTNRCSLHLRVSQVERLLGQWVRSGKMYKSLRWKRKRPHTLQKKPVRNLWIWISESACDFQTLPRGSGNFKRLQARGEARAQRTEPGAPAPFSAPPWTSGGSWPRRAGGPRGSRGSRGWGADGTATETEESRLGKPQRSFTWKYLWHFVTTNWLMIKFEACPEWGCHKSIILRIWIEGLRLCVSHWLSEVNHIAFRGMSHVYDLPSKTCLAVGGSSTVTGPWAPPPRWIAHVGCHGWIAAWQD